MVELTFKICVQVGVLTEEDKDSQTFSIERDNAHK